MIETNCIIENDASATSELKQQMEEQLELQKQIQNQLLKQGENQKEVNDRLDNQEALTEKIVRQVDYLRSILFERTNDLTEKVNLLFLHPHGILNLVNYNFICCSHH